MTLVRHRLLTPDGAPIAGQKVTAQLMVRDDLADDSYALDVPDNASFSGGVIRKRATATSGADGWLTWDLTPNEFIVPDGTYYQMLGLSRSRTILWVPDSAVTVELSECRLNLVDFNDSNLVIVQGPRGQSGSATVTPEAVAASLPERLSDTALKAAFGRSALSAASYGVGPASAPSTNATQLQKCITDALAGGFDVQLPEGQFGIVGQINVPAPGGIEIRGAGARSTLIHQTQKPSRVFSVTGQNVTIRDLGFVGDGLDMTGTTKVEYQNYCGVRFLPGAHGGRAINLYGKDLYIVVRGGGDHNGDPLVPLGQAPLERIVIDGIEGDGVWSAVFGGTWRGLSLSRVTGKYRKAFNTGTGPDVGPPPHLIYLYSPDIHEGAADIYDPALRSSNVTVTDCTAFGCYDTQGGYAAFALKDIDGLAANNLTARDCPGLLDLIELSDGVITNAVGMDDRYPLTGTESARAAVAIKDSRRVRITGKLIKAVGSDGRAVFTESTAESCDLDVDVVSKHTVENLTASVSDVRLAGTGNTFRGSVENAGTAAWYAGIIVTGTGSRGRLVNPRAKGKYQRSLRLDSNHPGAFIDYDPVLVQPDYSVPGATTLSIAGGSNYIRRDRSIGQTIPGGYDDFNRPDALGLGATVDGKLWVPNSTAGGQHTIVSGQAVAVNVGGALYETVDTGSANGTMTAVIGTVNGNGGGLVARFVDNLNEIMIQCRTATGDNRYRIVQRLANTQTSLATATQTSAVGDTIAVTLAGTTITVTVNGAQILTGTMDAAFTASTKHGLYGTTSGNVAWDSWQFAAA